jgi:hypothetical protein
MIAQLLNVPAINTDVSLTLGRVDLLARERTNLKPIKKKGIVSIDGCFCHVGWILSNWIDHLLHLEYGCMAKEEILHYIKVISLP